MAYAQFAATVCNSTTTESEKGVKERERVAEGEVWGEVLE